MAYNNNWNVRRQTYSENYIHNQRTPFNPNYGYGGYNNSARKNYFRQNGGRRSQVKLINKDGVSYLSGWKVGKTSGFRSFFVSPAKSPKTITSKSGKVWVTCKVSVTNKTHGTSGLFPAFWNTANNMVICKTLGLILNPNTGFISYTQRKK